MGLEVVPLLAWGALMLGWLAFVTVHYGPVNGLVNLAAGLIGYGLDLLTRRIERTRGERGMR
jgi:hypothetical protein